MPEKPYDPQTIELKWHERWSNDPDLYRPLEDLSRPKYYVLEMLPYPSGTLHIGHIRNYAIGDALARYKWMRGFNVLHPMGWDAFGLPAENAAIANKRDPYEWTMSNIENMKRQHRRMGFSYDWSREVATCEPDYYRWNQWFFLKMLERGLAYRKKALVNWCPECGTVLANEQVVDGCCWRHESTPVEQRALEQWFLRITDYADELLRRHREAGRRLARARAHHAAQLDRPVGRRGGRFHAGRNRREDPRVHHAHRHHLWRYCCDPGARASADRRSAGRRKEGRSQTHDRCAGGERSGRHREGRLLYRPLRDQSVHRRGVPIWVGNFVLMGYGTGAIMAVPGPRRARFRILHAVWNRRSGR